MPEIRSGVIPSPGRRGPGRASLERGTQGAVCAGVGAGSLRCRRWAPPACCHLGPTTCMRVRADGGCWPPAASAMCWHPAAGRPVWPRRSDGTQRSPVDEFDHAETQHGRRRNYVGNSTSERGRRSPRRKTAPRVRVERQTTPKAEGGRTASHRGGPNVTGRPRCVGTGTRHQDRSTHAGLHLRS